MMIKMWLWLVFLNEKMNLLSGADKTCHFSYDRGTNQSEIVILKARWRERHGTFRGYFRFLAGNLGPSTCVSLRIRSLFSN